MKLLMGIDIGTSKTAISLIDPENHKIIKTIEKETPYIQNTEPWKKEQSPEKIVSVIYELFNSCKDYTDNVTAIGITGQMHGILGLDEHGNPITHFVTWQDGRGNIAGGKVNSKNHKTLLDEIKQIADKTDTKGISSGFGIVTLYYWLKNDINPYKVATITDYIGMLLTGNNKPYIDPTMAESLGCFDVGKGDWKATLLKALNIPIEILPELAESTTVIGLTGKGIFSEFFKKGVPVVVSIGDNQASFLGSVKHYTDTVLLNIGTGAQITIAEASFKRASSFPFVDGIDVQIRPFISNKYLVAGNAISGGIVYKTLYNFFKSVGSELFGISDFDNLYPKMEKIAREILDKYKTDDKSFNNLEVYPLFAGKRSSPEEKGWIHGISLTNLLPSILILETLKGMIQILTEMFDDNIINSKSYLVGSGNGIRRNKLLQELIEKRFKRSLHICSYSEEAVVGAAINAAVAIGIYKNFNEAANLINYSV